MEIGVILYGFHAVNIVKKTTGTVLRRVPVLTGAWKKPGSGVYVDGSPFANLLGKLSMSRVVGEGCYCTCAGILGKF